MRDLPAQVGSLRILYRYPGLILLKHFFIVNYKVKTSNPIIGKEVY